MSVNRLAGYFDKMPRPTETTEVAKRNAQVLRDFIKKHFNGKDKELADLSKISTTKLSQLLNQGFESAIPSLRAVCRVLRIDVDAICQGRIVRIDVSGVEPELVRLARQLVGTDSGDQATNMLRHLIELELRAGAHRNT